MSRFAEDLAKLIADAVLEEHIEEMLFDLVKTTAVLAYSNGTSKEGMLDATTEMYDTLYKKMQIMEAAGAVAVQ
jgi:hypothetical protein